MKKRADLKVGPYVIAIRGGPQRTRPTGPPYVIAGADKGCDGPLSLLGSGSPTGRGEGKGQGT